MKLHRLASELRRLWHPALGPWGEFEGGGAPPSRLTELAAYGIMDPSAIVVNRQPLYDRLVYDDAGHVQLNFFQLPIGQGSSSATGGTGAVKTRDDTNMESAGQLPSPKMFLATSIEVIFEPGSISTANAWSPIDIAYLTNASAASVNVVQEIGAQNDVARILQSGWLDFFVGDTSQLQNARLDSFPPKTRIEANAAQMVSGNLGISGLMMTRATGRPFFLNPPVLLMPNVNFRVSLNWGVAVVTATGDNARITVRLDGFQYRRAQ